MLLIAVFAYGAATAGPNRAGAAPPVATATGAATAKNGKNLRAAAGFTPEREAAALTFVRTHHPELADLLERLKERRPHEYEKAIRDLFRVSERLAVSREEFPLRYELELKQWKLTSRIQVQTARLAMGRTPEQEQELKQLLAEQLAAHRELLALNLERATARAAALSQELADLDGRKQAILDAKFEKALKSTEKKTNVKPDSQTEKTTTEKTPADKQ
ncbi:MAG: hypothetical protein K8U03_05740 [Planctomycetia bacterium]|nr:hypothetical protein [Planctomycetia bacterium]